MRLTRRDFLKTASLLTLGSLGTLLPPRFANLDQSEQNSPNVIILLFDALSARHMSLYGYGRLTTPHLAKFAEKATVYHRHYSAGNFTTPGTASLLTGTYPWTHRAFQQSGLILRKLADHNLFRSVGDVYQKAGYAQNIWVDLLLYQFEKDLDVHVKSTAYGLDEYIHYNDGIWQNDPLITFRSYETFLESDYAIPGSLYSSFLDKLRASLSNEFGFREARKEYPRGIPNFTIYKFYFLLEPVFEGITQEILNLRNPFVGYFHLFAPHEPYLPNRRYIGVFDDGWNPDPKPIHPLSAGLLPDQQNRSRRGYDEFIANVDAEFGKLYTRLQNEGLLESSYLIVTSDHGELFERGVNGHVTPLLYDPVVHVPLIISAPGQSTRQDIYSPTSCVDVLPTLAKLTGNSIPDWVEGNLLPGLGGDDTQDRSVFVVEAKKNLSRSPMREATFAMFKGDYKLIWYIGYPGYDDVYEFYDLKQDPEELVDLSSSPPEMFSSMKDELQTRIAEADQPFRLRN